ncbi:MAG: hypothetical protein WBX95_20630, partial [Xanthobacteraceae bacterium]
HGPIENTGLCYREPDIQQLIATASHWWQTGRTTKDSLRLGAGVFFCEAHFEAITHGRKSSGSLAMLAAIGASRCCGFLATPTNISRFDVATGLTNPGSEGA